MLKFGYFLHPTPQYIAENSWGTEFLLGKLSGRIGNGSMLWFVLAQISIVLQALIINRLATEYKLFQSDTFIPAAIFILISSFFPSWNVLSAPMLASWPLLIALNNMLRLHITQSPRKLLYNSGILVTIAGILHLPAIIFLIFLIWALIIRKTLTISDIMILLLGALTPLYFVGIGLYLADAAWQDLKINALGLIDLDVIFTEAKLALASSLLLLLMLLGTINLNHQMGKNIEAIKKNWWIVIAFLLIASIFTAIQVGAEQAFGYVFIMPATLLISALWMAERSKWIKIAAFWCTIATIIYLQYF